MPKMDSIKLKDSPSADEQYAEEQKYEKVIMWKIDALKII